MAQFPHLLLASQKGIGKVRQAGRDRQCALSLALPVLCHLKQNRSGDVLMQRLRFGFRYAPCHAFEKCFERGVVVVEQPELLTVEKYRQKLAPQLLPDDKERRVESKHLRQSVRCAWRLSRIHRLSKERFEGGLPQFQAARLLGNHPGQRLHL